jgi:hypothetical protein
MFKSLIAVLIKLSVSLLGYHHYATCVLLQDGTEKGLNSCYWSFVVFVCFSYFNVFKSFGIFSVFGKHGKLPVFTGFHDLMAWVSNG